MDNATKERVLSLFENAADIVEAIPPRKRDFIDEVEIVLVDIVNNKAKQRRTYNLFELINSIRDESKPIGIILCNWSNPDKMQVKEFPGISNDEQSLLMHAFAEAQDELKEMYLEDSEDE